MMVTTHSYIVWFEYYDGAEDRVTLLIESDSEPLSDDEAIIKLHDAAMQEIQTWKTEDISQISIRSIHCTKSVTEDPEEIWRWLGID